MKDGLEVTCAGKKGMTYIIIHVIWLVIKVVSAYNFTCPHPGQWNLIAETKNCTRKDYVCLLDDVELKDTEACKSLGPRIENNGFKAVLNNGNLNAIACSSARFQPLQFSSFKDSRCVFEKSSCSEEGQVLADNGTSKTDRSCRCDYCRGYALINETIQICIPSKEDCTCYLKTCNANEILSPDYKCVKEIEQPGNYTCTQLLDKNSIESGTADVSPMHAFSNRYYDKVYRYRAVAVCLIFIVIIAVLFLLLVICWNQFESLISNYWSLLKKRFTEFRNTCKKEYFVEPLKEIVECSEGEHVTLSCKVNKEKTTGTWFRDGKKLDKKYSDIQFIAEGKFHKLEICKVKSEHRGYYTLHIKKIVSSSLLIVLGKVTQEQINYLRIIYLLETVAEPVVRKIFDREFHPQQLRKTLDQNKRKKLDILRKKKHLNIGEYNQLFPVKVVEYCIKFKLQRYDYHKTKEKKKKKLAKTIENAVSSLYSNVDGNHEVSFTTFEPGSMVVVLKLSSYNNYVLQNLKNIIQTAVIDDRYIGNLKTESTGFSFIEQGDTSVPISSEDFDIRLMMILMRNLADFDISKKLPLDADKSESADLSRIASIRNDIFQNSDKQISDENFEKNWKQLTEAVIRREKTYAIVCEELKKFKPSPQESQKYLQSKNMESNSPSVDSLNKWKELMSKQSIQKVAKDAVQKIFDEQFPPETLRTAILERFEFLSNLKDQKKITESEWKNLRSAEHENVSSGTFDTKLMIMLLKDSQLKETSRLKAIEHLNNLLSKTDLDFLAIRQTLTEVSGEEVDFK